MSRLNHLRQAKSLSQKYGAGRKSQEEDNYYPREEEEVVKEVSGAPPSKASVSLFDKINRMFEDPTIKDIKEIDNDEMFLAKDLTTADSSKYDLPSIKKLPSSRQSGAASSS